MDKPQIVAYIQKPVNFTLYHCNWIPQSAKFVVVGSQPNGTGSIQVYELEDGDAKLVRDVRKAKSFKCGTFGASGIGQQYYATGDFDGRLQIWNLEDTDTTVYGVQAHDEIINCIDGVGGQGIGEGAPELVTGSRDGCVRVWDTRQKHDPVARMEPRAGEPKRDCWSVAFGDAYSTEDRCVAAGYDNGDVKLFDLRAMSVRWTTNVRNGVCSVEFDRKDIEMNKLAVTTLESHMHVFDLRTQHPVSGFASVGERAHKSTIWTVRHVPQNRDLFATCGGNGGVCLWKYDYPTARRRRAEDGADEGVPGTVQQLQNVNLATQPINSLDWCKEKLGLAVTTAFDQTIRVLVVTKLNTY